MARGGGIGYVRHHSRAYLQLYLHAVNSFSTTDEGRRLLSIQIDHIVKFLSNYIIIISLHFIFNNSLLSMSVGYQSFNIITFTYLSSVVVYSVGLGRWASFYFYLSCHASGTHAYSTITVAKTRYLPSYIPPGAVQPLGRTLKPNTVH